MRNQRFILFWLWLAFAVVLGHNVVPHHHQDQETGAIPGDPHHHGDEDDNALADFFSHFAHSSSTTTVTFLDGSHTLQVDLKQTPAEPALLTDLHFSAYDIFIPQQLPSWSGLLLSPDFSRHLPSRAPPLA